MIKYAKIKDSKIGLVEVGLGTNSQFYKSIGMTQMDVQQSDIDGNWYLVEKCPMKTDEQKEMEEKERIQALSMTRSDFFDGMIKAFGLDDEALLWSLNIIVNNERFALPDIEKKIAINNYKNALNFYRKHPLFEILSDVSIPTSETTVIGIDSEQWDKFFDETNKGNPDAYLYLKYTEEDLHLKNQ